MPGPIRMLAGGILAGALSLAGSPGLGAQSIEGRVVESWTAQPVSGAVVVVIGTTHEGVTDPSGRFAFGGVPGGRYDLLVQHTGYHTVVRTVDVPAEGLSDLVISVPVRVIPLEGIRAEVITPLERRRRAWGTAHHMYVTREDLDEYELRGALHAGDALRLHKPTAVHIVEAGITSRSGPGVCIMSTRARTRRTSSKPGGGGCAPVFLDGIRVTGAGASALLYDLPLSDIEAIEFLPPADAIIRFGHAGSAGAVLITMRRGGRRLEPVQPLSTWARQGPRRSDYLAVGATAGFAASFGAQIVGSLVSRGGDQICQGGCAADLARLLGVVAVGIGVGELVWRMGPGG